MWDAPALSDEPAAEVDAADDGDRGRLARAKLRGVGRGGGGERREEGGRPGQGEEHALLEKRFRSEGRQDSVVMG
jgi:hypothetical protein